MVLKNILFASCLFCSQILASEKNTISWQTYHRPPGVIKTGQDQGQGFVQKVLKLITDKMPNYTHDMPLTTLERAIIDIKSGKYVCHPSLLITKEREKFMHFSDASLINPTIRLIARKGELDKYEYDGAVSLKELLQYQNFSFALVKGRSYTTAIDVIIEEYIKKKNTFLMSNTDLSPIFQMIELSRVDASLAYPFEYSHYIQSQGSENIQMYRISGLPQYTIGSIACPKNDWGFEVISEVNKILAEIKPTQAYQDAMTTWWEKERSNPSFQLFYHNEFLSQ